MKKNNEFWKGFFVGLSKNTNIVKPNKPKKTVAKMSKFDRSVMNAVKNDEKKGISKYFRDSLVREYKKDNETNVSIKTLLTRYHKHMHQRYGTYDDDGNWLGLLGD